MKIRYFTLSFAFLVTCLWADTPDFFFLKPKEPGSFSADDLLEDLDTVKIVDEDLNRRLPIIYNYSLTAGYFNMPSARSPRKGAIGLGFSSVSPYRNYSAHFQLFDRIELSANYHIMVGYEDPILGPGFGDVADRSANFKLVFLRPEDTDYVFPGLALGMEDFFGSENFNAKYAVITQVIRPFNMEASLGYGKDRIHGFFGGIAVYPFYQSKNVFLKGIGALIEYDATDYKRGPSPFGRTHKNRFNGGFYYIFGDFLHLSISSMRGEKLAGSISVHTDLGATKHYVPQFLNPKLYTSPQNTESIGALRPYKTLAHDLAYAFRGQSLTLFEVRFSKDAHRKTTLWLNVNNPSYRNVSDLKERIVYLLSKLTPENIDRVVVIVEGDATPIFQWEFRGKDLTRFREKKIGEYELSVLSPREPISRPIAQAKPVYKKNYSTMHFLIRPRLRSFFGNSSGKYKFDFGILFGPEGFIQNQIYYRISVGAKLFSGFEGVKDTDKLNPSQIINVRSDSISYYNHKWLTLEKAFLQKNFSLSGGWFARIAAGYFEIAYGGAACEILFQRPDLPWALGFDGAILKKRRYKGVAFTNYIRKLDRWHPTYQKYLGVQYFLNLYYDIPKIQCKAQVKIGQFLAKDKGVRATVTRYFSNGVMLSFWIGATNAVDMLNGSRYFEKGIGFSVPLDLFSAKANKERLGTAMSFWLRDTAAVSESGKPLYDLVHSQQIDH